MRGAEVSPKKFFFLTLTQNANRQVLPAMLEAEDLMCAWRFGALVIEEAMYGGGTDSKASKEAEIRAGGGHLGSEEAQGIPKGEAGLFVLSLDGKPY